MTFGVGERDERPATRGALHALEHLVMDSARRTPIDINASVGLSDSEFTAEGRPELVAAYLEQVCRALSDPPVQRLNTEAKILAAEGESDGGASAPLHRARYGHSDLGIQDLPAPDPTTLTATAIAEYAKNWFLAENAFLIVDGPLPELRLPLLRGLVPVRNWSQPRRGKRPQAVTVDGPACAVSLLLPPAEPSRLDVLATAIVTDRIAETLRHELALSYVVEHETAPVADGRTDLVVFAEPEEEHAEAAIRALVSTVSHLLEHGPTQAEMDTALDKVIEQRRGRSATIAAQAESAMDELFGVVRPPLDPERFRASTREDVSAYLRSLTADVLYLADETAEDALAGLGVDRYDVAVPAGPLPSGTVFKPSLFARLLSSEARSATVVLTADGLTLDLAGRRQRIGWTDAVGVMVVDDDEMVVFGADGSAIPVGRRLYRDGDRLTQAVRANIPASQIYQLPQETDD